MYSLGVLAPVLLGPYSFPNRLRSFFSLPSNILPILVILIIRPRSFLLLVRHTISPSAISTRSSYHLPFPPTLSRLINHLPFHNRSAQHLCIFLAILFSQFYCTTVLFIPNPQILRCLHAVGTPKARSLALIVLFSLSRRLGVVFREFGNELSVYRYI